MVEVKVENVVASTNIGKNFNLNEISLRFETSEYDSRRFPGLIYRIKKPKVAVLLFSSGKCVFTGAKSVKDIHKAVEHLKERLTDLDLEVVEEPNIIIQNIVATFDIGSDLNLNNVAISLGLEHVEYEPEQFPGLVYRLAEPKVVMLLFGSGKIVSTGAKNYAAIDLAAQKLIKELSGAGLMRERVNR